MSVSIRCFARAVSESLSLVLSLTLTRIFREREKVLQARAESCICLYETTDLPLLHGNNLVLCQELFSHVFKVTFQLNESNLCLCVESSEDLSS